MAALAELLQAAGANVRGSDVPERFFTDEILEAAQIPFSREFSAANLEPRPDVVIYSAAYSLETHPELVEARRLGLPILVYPEALGEFSRSFPVAAGISGVHGKTTTTAMAGMIVRALRLPGSVLAGSLVPDFGQRATLSLGPDLLVAETCEYRRHFLYFHPTVILVTSIELDHTDYFKDDADIHKAFEEYVAKLPRSGVLVYCADEAGAAALARHTAQVRPDVELVSYGINATGAFRLVDRFQSPGESHFHLSVTDTPFALHIPGGHNVLNASGAIALVATLAQKTRNSALSSEDWGAIARTLAEFRGTRRRSQVVGEAAGVLVIDDYGHHPTAVALTLQGLKAFYPGRRLVLDFMSHTYSRTKALLQEFAHSFAAADEVVLHKIYSSARETDTQGISGRTLYEATQRVHSNVHYFDEILDAVPYFEQTLRPGDLLVTMGAGDNWKAGTAFLAAKRGKNG